MMEKIHAPAGYTMRLSNHNDEFWVDGVKRIHSEEYLFINGPHMPNQSLAIAEWNAIFEGNES